MSPIPITHHQFTQRLTALCVESKAGWPTKRSDRLILMKSAILTLTPDRVYTEREINDALQYWLFEVGSSLSLDHVVLRRYLVDDGFLSRESNGSAYRVHSGYQKWATFEPAVETTDVLLLIHAAAAELARKKQAYQAR